MFDATKRACSRVGVEVLVGGVGGGWGCVGW